MNGSGTSNGTDNSKNPLLSLVRKLSKKGGGSGRIREKGNRIFSEGPPELLLSSSPLSSSSGYRQVTPNVAPSSLYPSSILPVRHEVLVWGRPPANLGEKRIFEGIELVDEGPSQRPGRSDPLRQVQRLPSKSQDGGHLEEIRPELQSRRSFDSLFSTTSVNGYIPILTHQNKFSTRGAGETGSTVAGPRRAVSVRVNGPKQSQLGRVSSISSTPRAKPARSDFNAIPLRTSSPFQGSPSTLERSSSTGANGIGGLLDKAEEERLRDTYGGKGTVWAVARGWKRGIVANFEEAEQQTRSFPGPILRQFDTVDEAIEYLNTPSQITPSRALSNIEKVNSAIVHSDSLPLQRQFSLQNRPATPEHFSDGAIRRVLRSPATNPFLTDLSRKNSGQSYSRGSPTKNGQLLRRLSISRDTSASEILKPNELILPPPVLSVKHPIDSNKSPNIVSVTPIIMCQDLESCIIFYQTVLDFVVESDHQYKGEIILRHQITTQSFSLTLRLQKPLSPITANIPSPSKIPLSMYRSSILIDVGFCDIHQLHKDITIRNFSFQAGLHSLSNRRPSLNQSRVEEIETKPWGSLEFMVFDPEGNMIILTGSTLKCD